MSKRLLIFAPYALSTSHHEVAMEMICEHREKGWDIQVVRCTGSLDTCDQNASHGWLRCLSCKSVGSESMKLIGIPPENIHSFTRSGKYANIEIPEFKDLNALKAFSYNCLPVGIAVAASVVTGHTRDVCPDLRKHRHFIEKAIRNYMEIYDYTVKLLQQLRPDKLYLFNGRSFVYNAAFLAAKAMGVYVQVGERAVFEKYIIIENTFCLDMQHAHKELLSFKDLMANDPQAKQIADTFFTNCLQGKADLHISYCKMQHPGHLPAGFTKEKINIAIFSSSEDELSVHDDWHIPYFATQAEAVRYLANQLSKDLNYHLHLRIHPNLKGLNSTQEKRLLALKDLPNVTVIPSESPVSSYDLLRACDMTVTFGSTIGIEAVYWEKPSICVGPSWHGPLNACYQPKSREELVQLVRSNPPPKPKEMAYPFAYWWEKRSKPFRFIKPQDPKVQNAALLFGKNIMSMERWVYLLNRLACKFS